MVFVTFNNPWFGLHWSYIHIYIIYSTNCAKVPLHCVYARLNVKRSPTRYYSQDTQKCGSRERTSVCACTRDDLRFKRSKRNCRISLLHNSRFDTSWHFIFDSITRAYTCLRWGPLRNWYCNYVCYINFNIIYFNIIFLLWYCKK